MKPLAFILILLGLILIPLSGISKPKDVIVAIIDTGVDSSHPALKGKIIEEKSFVPGILPIDTNGHGTHVAGTIVLLNPDAKIISLKYYSSLSSAKQNGLSGIEALRYAVERRVNIINYSGGGTPFNDEEYEILKRAEVRGILVVAAAGNDGKNLDLPDNKYYPACYDLKNIISVASIGPEGLSISSNYGAISVDIAALGEDIIGPYLNHRWARMSGTSMSTAVISGAASLILQKMPYTPPKEVEEILYFTGERLPELIGKVRSEKTFSLINLRDYLERKPHERRSREASSNYQTR